MHIPTSRPAIAGLVLAAGASALAWLPEARAHEVHFTGRAIGAHGAVTFSTLTKKVLLANVPMACSGTAREEIVSIVSNPQPLGVDARNVRGYTIGTNDVSSAEAGIDELQVNLANGLRIDATGLQSHANSTCDAATFKITASGGADVGSLFINGEGRAVTGEPNQTFEIPGVGTVIVNEQIRPSHREIIVNALRVVIADPTYPASGELVFAHARAKITCSRS
jgi:hypothetical protein